MREVERKYALGAGAEPPELGDLPGVAEQADAGTVMLTATYFDTADLRLAARGITLRRRTGGDDAGWHVKLPAGADARDEVRAPLGRATRTVPHRFADLVLAYTRGAPLEPAARIRTERTRRRLLDADGGVLAEVAADEVRAEDLAGGGDGGTDWRELEIELVDGDADLLDAAEARLRAAGVERAESASKLLRTLAARLAPGPDGAEPGRDATAGEVVLAYMRSQVDALRMQDVRVRLDRDDSVHKMRVASRRLRSALRTFGRIVDRDATRGLDGELRWLAGELGAVRDAEVMLDHLRRQLGELPADLVLGPVDARLSSELGGGYDEARERLLATLSGARYLAILDALEVLLTDPPLTGKASGRARPVLRRQVRRAWRKVDAAMTAAAGEPPGAARDEARHRARRAAKRARYAGEAVAPVAKRARRFARGMEAVQEELGAYQDSVVARNRLRELTEGGDGEAEETAFTYGLLYAAEERRAEAAERALPGVWRRASRRKRVRWLR